MLWKIHGSWHLTRWEVVDVEVDWQWRMSTRNLTVWAIAYCACTCPKIHVIIKCIFTIWHNWRKRTNVYSDGEYGARFFTGSNNSACKSRTKLPACRTVLFITNINMQDCSYWRCIVTYFMYNLQLSEPYMDGKNDLAVEAINEFSSNWFCQLDQ